MVRIDTLKLGISRIAMKSFNKDLFIYRIDTDPETGEMSECFMLRKDIIDDNLGLNRLIIHETESKIEIEFSAKALGDKYLDGINHRNISNLFDHIRDSGIADFDTDAVLDSAKVYKVDVVSNLILSKPIEEYLRALKLLANRGNYYKVFHETGIEILSTAENNDIRLKIYSKQPEMALEKRSNEKLLRLMAPDESKLLNEEAAMEISCPILSKHWALDKFKDILRVELSLRTFRDIRSTFGLPEKSEIRLKKILASDKKVLHHTFSKLFDLEFLKAEPFDKHSKSIKLSDKISRWGHVKMVEENGYDLKSTYRFIDDEVKGGKSRYKKKVRQAIIDISNKMVNTDRMLIKEIIKKLYDAD